LQKDYEKSEDDLKALQSVGQIIGEVLKQLDEERCISFSFFIFYFLFFIFLFFYFLFFIFYFYFLFLFFIFLLFIFLF